MVLIAVGCSPTGVVNVATGSVEKKLISTSGLRVKNKGKKKKFIIIYNKCEHFLKVLYT